MDVPSMSQMTCVLLRLEVAKVDGHLSVDCQEKCDWCDDNATVMRRDRQRMRLLYKRGNIQCRQTPREVSCKIGRWDPSTVEGLATASKDDWGKALKYLSIRFWWIFSTVWVIFCTSLVRFVRSLHLAYSIWRAEIAWAWVGFSPYLYFVWILCTPVDIFGKYL